MGGLGWLAFLGGLAVMYIYVDYRNTGFEQVYFMLKGVLYCLLMFTEYEVQHNHFYCLLVSLVLLVMTILRCKICCYVWNHLYAFLYTH